jgi:hypothetical protein
MKWKYMKIPTFHTQNISPIPKAQQPLVGQGLLIIEAFRSHSDASHLVRRPWTRDRAVAETSTWQHTTLTRDRHPCPRRDSNPQTEKQAATEPHFRPCGHRDRQAGRHAGTRTHTQNIESIKCVVLIYVRNSQRHKYKATSEYVTMHPILYIGQLVKKHSGRKRPEARRNIQDIKKYKSLYIRNVNFHRN